jgi:hypothetical protein
MPKYLGDVRCWVNSGKHLLSLSFSGFDPERTSHHAAKIAGRPGATDEATYSLIAPLLDNGALIDAI